jgi:hypothetical protein
METRRSLFVAIAMMLAGCGPAIAPQGSESGTSGDLELTTTDIDPMTTSSSVPDATTTSIPPSDPASSGSSSTTASDSSSSNGSESTTKGPAGCDAVDILLVFEGGLLGTGLLARAATDAFAEAIVDAFPGKSVHVGVITGREYVPPGATECIGLGDFVTWGELGTCSLSNGLRFATDEDDLVAAITCLTAIEWAGEGYSRPVGGIIRALSEENAAPGACNEGFLREDAVLGIFIVNSSFPIENTPDEAHPDTDTSGWYDAIAATKSGDVSAISMFGFVAIEPFDCYEQGGSEATNFVDLIDAFGGERRSFCQDSPADFEAGFIAGVDQLADTCAAYDGL